jgi:surface antigen
MFRRAFVEDGVMRTFSVILFAMIGASFVSEGFATPPDHAPAHGWRKKNDPYYVGYSGRKWERDYAVLSGRCNREEIGAVLGGVAGGVIGQAVAERNERVVGTIVGAAIGALIGARIGRELDEGDRACIGHSLEIGVNDKPIVWRNTATGVRYELIPRGGRKAARHPCRDFTLVVVYGSARVKQRSSACQNRPGVWKLKET